MTTNGNRTGEMSINTWYLIQADAPEDPDKVKQFTTIVNESRSMGIEVLPRRKGKRRRFSAHAARAATRKPAALG